MCTGLDSTYCDAKNKKSQGEEIHFFLQFKNWSKCVINQLKNDNYC